MDFSNRMFTYPVLRRFNDDYLKSSLNYNLISLTDNHSGSEFLKFRVEVSTDNPELNKLIDQKQAEFIVHVECSQAFFRNYYTVTNGFADIKIPYEDLENSLEVSVMLMAKTVIYDYRSSDFNPDYEDLTFTLEKGSFLAYGYLGTLKIIKDRPSFGVMRNPILLSLDPKILNDGFNSTIDSQGRIIIHISRERYKQFLAVKNQIQKKDFLQRQLILPVLVQLFSQMKYSAEFREDHNTDFWYFQSADFISKKDLNLEELLEEENGVLLASQILLDYPVGNLFDQIHRDIDSENQEDD